MTRLTVLEDQLVAEVGLTAAVDACLDLLGGADRAEYLPELRLLSGHALEPGSPTLDPASWGDFWVRSWGARGLLRIWEERAAPAVVRGLDDEHWRPAETCLRVASRRQVGEAGPGAERLVLHELPRVRQQALRCLGIVGDTEHVATVRTALDDPEPAVRRAAALALDRMTGRLDLGQGAPGASQASIELMSP